jgi:glycosyltransferase involved in cell wall biosynthesis
VKACLDSLFQQDYGNWQVVVCVEPSEDDTFNTVFHYLSEHDNGKILLLRNQERQYVPKNHVDGIRMSKPANDDVIVLLDGDDTLYGNDVLSYLNSVYQDELVWVTWGSYIFSHNRRRGQASQPIPTDDNLTQRQWRYSHLKTFRYFLFKGVQDPDLRSLTTREYYKTAGDMALMFPMIEMAGQEHGKFIDKILYIYNHISPYNDERIHAKDTKQSHQEIYRRTPYSRRTREELILLP